MGKYINKSRSNFRTRFSLNGARSYISFAGGIESNPWLGSKSTFHKAGVGGIDGHAIKKGQKISIGQSATRPGRKVREDCIPNIHNSGYGKLK